MPHETVGARQSGNARRLRRELTDAERKLWYLLRDHRLEGVGFRRQVPIGDYVVDFASHRMKLVIEVDGGQHGQPAGLERDRVRDAFLKSRGYRVLRLWNNDILENPDGVYAAIVAALPPSTPGGGSEEQY